MKKLLFDFFPIVIFFVVFKYADDMPWLRVGPLAEAENLVIATAVLIPATLFQVVFSYWRTRRVEKMYLITLVLIVVMGGATILLNEPAYIKWKVTVANWLFAAGFLGSEFIGKKNVLQHMMGEHISLPKQIWSRLIYMWFSFFTFVGALNIYIAFSGEFTEEQWVNFKLFGMLGLTVVFIILQGIYLARHVDSDEVQQPDNK